MFKVETWRATSVQCSKFNVLLFFLWIVSQARNDDNAHRHCEGVSPKQSREMQRIMPHRSVAVNRPCYFLLFDDYNGCLAMAGACAVPASTLRGLI